MSKLIKSIMSLWPSKKQWKSWTLSSKLTAIGAFVGIVAIPLSILLFALGVFLKPNIEVIVRNVANEHKPQLDAKFPIAHTVFGVHQDSFVVPKGLMPENLRVDWNTGKVQLSNNRLIVTFPDMVLNGKMFVVGNATSVENRIGAKSNPVIKIGQFDPRVEVIGIHNGLIVVALGFPESDSK